MQEGLTDKEIKKLTGTKSTFRTYLKKTHGITPEEYRKISEQLKKKTNDGKPDLAARVEARQQMREWKEKYAQHAWGGGRAAGKR